MKDEHFELPRSAELVGRRGAFIEEHWEANRVFAPEVSDLIWRIAGIGIDCHERNAPRSVLFGQLRQPRRIQPGQRTLGADEDDDHEFSIIKCRQPHRLTLQIGQLKIGDGARLQNKSAVERQIDSIVPSVGYGRAAAGNEAIRSSNPLRSTRGADILACRKPLMAGRNTCPT